MRIWDWELSPERREREGDEESEMVGFTVVFTGVVLVRMLWGNWAWFGMELHGMAVRDVSGTGMPVLPLKVV